MISYSSPSSRKKGGSHSSDLIPDGHGNLGYIHTMLGKFFEHFNMYCQNCIYVDFFRDDRGNNHFEKDPLIRTDLLSKPGGNQPFNYLRVVNVIPVF